MRKKVLIDGGASVGGVRTGALKVEIIGMPEIRTSDTNESVVVKGKKRINLPHFSRTDWAAVSWRFIDERNVLLTGGNKKVSVDYEGLGFSNAKKNTPDKAWFFLFDMAQRGGETQTLPTPIPDKIKQAKQRFADLLRNIFKNDTDPFYDSRESKTYKAKFKLTSPEIEPSTNKDDLGIQEFWEEMNKDSE